MQKKVFFEYYKSIENFQAVDVCLCEQYRVAKVLRTSKKTKEDTVTYQFQNIFNLTLLNQVKFDLKK